MYSNYQRLMLFVFENVAGVQLNLYGDVDQERVQKKEECVLYISNHQCTMDWAVVDMLAVRQGSLGHLRYVLKHALQYMPLYGWYFWMHGCVYVRRAGQFQKDSSIKQFQYVAQLEQPSWLVIFPEGTRYNPNKKKVIEDSKRHATEIGVKPLDYVLMPRSRGFEMALTNFRHRLDAVYDVTIAYSHAVDHKNGRVKLGPSMFDFVSSDPNAKLHVHLKRIPIDEVPTESGAIRKWLYDRFQKKDELLKQYYSKRLSANTPKDDDDAFPDLKIRDSCLPLQSTLPSVLVISGCGLLPFFLAPHGGKAYAAILVFGSLFCIGWMKFKKAA